MPAERKYVNIINDEVASLAADDRYKTAHFMLEH